MISSLKMKRPSSIFICIILSVNPAVSQNGLFHTVTEYELSIIFLGDLNFGESYQTNPVYNRGVNIIDKFGYDYMFQNIGALLMNSDLTIANLETPLLDSIKSRASARKLYVHWSSANKTAEYLMKYNITALSLANNHTFDYGSEGLSQTVSVLQENNFNYFGAGNNTDEARKPMIKRFISAEDTFTLAVLSGFEYRKSYDSIYDYYAGENAPGVNMISVEHISESVKELRGKYGDIYIIFFPHWGRNYFWKTGGQAEAAHSIIDAGVDLIIGHGAHMVQEVEYYNGHWIIYSIGNSVFNAPGRYSYYGGVPFSFIAELRIRNVKDDKEKHLRLYPIFTDNLKTDYQVRFLDDEEMNECYNILRAKSNEKKVFNDDFRLKENGSYRFFEIQLNE